MVDLTPGTLLRAKREAEVFESLTEPDDCFACLSIDDIVMFLGEKGIFRLDGVCDENGPLSIEVKLLFVLTKDGLGWIHDDNGTVEHIKNTL